MADPTAAFVEIPGMRGLRVSREEKDGQTLEVVEGQRGVIIPAMMHTTGESGRVLAGSLRFMQDGVVRELHAGDRWEVAPGAAQGPHVFLEDNTRVALLRSPDLV
jgi:quercetin dioxygenase-like cupin family protein